VFARGYVGGEIVNQDVLRIYKRVLAVPEGPDSKEHRGLVRKHIREMDEDAVNDILGREVEIEERSWDEFLLRKEILLQLGFMNTEAQFYARCRLNSPGIRTLIKERAEITKHATPQEVKQINDGSRGTLRALTRLYGKRREE